MLLDNQKCETGHTQIRSRSQNSPLTLTTVAALRVLIGCGADVHRDRSGDKMGGFFISWRMGVSACIASMCVGCASNGLSGTMGSWQGSHIDDVRLAWGQPDTCVTDGEQRVCAWSTPAVNSFVGGRAQCVRSLAVGPDGIVTGWCWRGDHCADTASAVMANARFERPDALTAESASPGQELAATGPAVQFEQARSQ